MTHTSGPWRVITRNRTSKPDRFGRTTETRETFINGADGLGSIAKLYVGHDSDARLIAAAPELLHTLTQICNMIANGWIPPDTDRNEGEAVTWDAACQAYRDSCAYSEALATIAKARGES